MPPIPDSAMLSFFVYSVHGSVSASFTGRPSDGVNTWTRLSLCLFVDDLKSGGQTAKPYLEKIVRRGMIQYTHYTAIDRLYCNSVKNKKEPSSCRGRPETIKIPEVVSISKDLLKNH